MAGPARADVVFVRGIEFEASHGYTAAERRGTRRFRCDIELQADLSPSAASDKLADTIDYRRVCALIVDIGTERTFRLIEALAGAIADGILALYPRVQLTITLEKLAPPCAGAPAASGVRLTRGPRA
jgi:dihydroneopterin aldolase